MIQLERSVLKLDAGNWLDRCVCGTAEHLKQAAFLFRVDKFLDRELPLTNCDIELLLDLICEVHNCLSGDSVENASVIRGREQLKVAISALLQHEDIMLGHFLDVII